MTIKHSLRKILWNFGYDVVPFGPDRHYLARRRHLIRQAAIDVVLDVGANTGQFATELREDIGFRGDIVSFEPLTSAFRVLEQRSGSDPKWRAVQCALGDEDGTAEIQVAGNSYSSSLLKMLPAHIEAAPESAYQGREQIMTRRLDTILESCCDINSNIYLKIDVQGFERRVIKGAEASLPRIKAIQLEMSLTPLYEGESPFGEMHELLQSRGFNLYSLEPGFANRKTGQLLQVDGIYVRA